MTRIFISHATEDRQFVESRIVNLLEENGFETWYSKDKIQGSQNWERTIVEALGSSDWFLVVLSNSSARSPWVKSEIHWAFENREGKVVPVLFEDCALIDFHLKMSQIHFVDMRETNRNTDLELLNAFVKSHSFVEPTENKPSSASDKTNFLSLPRMRFHCGPWVPAEFFIGREEQLEEAVDLVDARQSFLIVGHPRAGKTSFCQKLKKEIDSKTDSNVLASYLNLQHCSTLSIETFLENTILNIAGEIARKVFGCKYTDLKSSSKALQYPHLKNDPLFKDFLGVFQLVSAKTHSNKGAIQQALSKTEFVELTRDLLEIATEKGRNGFIVLYDEANRLPVDISGQLLVGIGEALVQTGVMGGYVASLEMESEFDQLEQLFGAKLHLGPFSDSSKMASLISRYYFGEANRESELPFTKEAMQVLWKKSGGYPFLIQLISDRSIRFATSESNELVNAAHVNSAESILKTQRPKAFSSLRIDRESANG